MLVRAEPATRLPEEILPSPRTPECAAGVFAFRGIGLGTAFPAHDVFVFSIPRPAVSLGLEVLAVVVEGVGVGASGGEHCCDGAERQKGELFHKSGDQIRFAVIRQRDRRKKSAF